MASTQYSMKTVATIVTDFPQKFGVPRQSGLVKELRGKIILEPPYRDRAAVKGLEGYSHLWLLWVFSKNKPGEWSPTVRPPRLGGNRRVGVFATRSPNRPNPIGLSAVKLESIDYDDPLGPVLLVSGVDMVNGTPILDIKPYLPYADAYPQASGGFTDTVSFPSHKVIMAEAVLAILPHETAQQIVQLLRQDPRPAYHRDPNRIYTLSFAGYAIQFQATDAAVTVLSVKKEENK